MYQAKRSAVLSIKVAVHTRFSRGKKSSNKKSSSSAYNLNTTYVSENENVIISTFARF